MRRQVKVETDEAEVTVPVHASGMAMENRDRIRAIETAVIQINHFTEAMERLDLASWKGYVTGKLETYDSAAKVIIAEGVIGIILMSIYLLVK